MKTRYYSPSQYFQERYGKKYFRIPLNAHMTCPVRDGTIDTRGCIFCDSGSGDFALSYVGQRLDLNQIPYLHTDENVSYLGYFQAFSNTYAPKEKLEYLYRSVLEDPSMEGIVIGTRPDCFEEETYCLLETLKKQYPDKLFFIELGLQTILEEDAQWMHRGYRLGQFESCMQRLKEIGIPVIVHIIIGLPHETEHSLIETMQYLNKWNIHGVKLHLLHVLKGTELEKEYREGNVSVLEEETYLERICLCISYLDPSIVIYRLTGDGNEKTLVAPKWSLEKRKVLNHIQQVLKKRDLFQGCAL